MAEHGSKEVVCGFLEMLGLEFVNVCMVTSLEQNSQLRGEKGNEEYAHKCFSDFRETLDFLELSLLGSIVEDEDDIDEDEEDIDDMIEHFMDGKPCKEATL